MTEPTELLPCPFCGAPSEVENDFGTTWWVQCHGGQHTDGMLYGSRAEAVTAWNTRTPQPTQAQAVAITPPPIECNTEELKRAYAFGWWSALEKQRETAQAGAVPLTDEQIKEVMDLVSDWGMQSHLRGEAELDAHNPEATEDEITYAKECAEKERAAWNAIKDKLQAHGIKGGQHG